VWSEFLATDPELRVRFPALPDFLGVGGSGARSSRPRECGWGRLLGRRGGGSGLEEREWGRGDPSRWPRGALYPRELPLASPTGCGRKTGVVRSRTQATEFSLFSFISHIVVSLSPGKPHLQLK
jgi:hypothetical protein